jgi:hypothetical protein
MNKLIPKKIAEYVVIAILSLVVAFHMLVVLEVIPFRIVWGGRLQDRSEMLLFEITSIILNLFMLAIVFLQSSLSRFKLNRAFAKICLWLMFLLFLLNTVGNILSKNEMERLLFTPLTMLLAVLCFRLAADKGNEPLSAQ